jgi:xanthine dehydrogenase accessory factor
MNDLYEKIIFFKNKSVDIVLVTAVEKTGETPVEIGKKMLVTEKGESFGTVGGGALENYAIKKCAEIIKNRNHHIERYLLDKGKIMAETKTLPMVCGGTVTLFYEFLGVRNFVYIFGAGHVGQALANVLKPLNFHLTIIDNRQDILNRFQGGDIKVHQGFADFITQNKIKDDSLVVVCTPSHQHDYHVINKIIELKFKPKYVGMLCSIEKLHDYLKETYKQFGNDISLTNFYSPIGLDLGGGSPEDIAISIASEMLVVQQGAKGHKHMRERIDDHNRYW